MDRENIEFISTVRKSLTRTANLNLFSGITSPFILVLILLYLKFYAQVQNFNIILIVMSITIFIMIISSLFIYIYYKKLAKLSDEDLKKSRYYIYYQKRINFFRSK